jgi:hypothetical protein
MVLKFGSDLHGLTVQPAGASAGKYAMTANMIIEAQNRTHIWQ